jgi:oryzin
MQVLLQLLAFAATVPVLARAARLSAALAEHVVPGKWIVMLRPDADGATMASHLERVREIHKRDVGRRGGVEHESGGIERQYGFRGFKGYAGSFGAAAVEELRRMPEVGSYRRVSFCMP